MGRVERINRSRRWTTRGKVLARARGKIKARAKVKIKARGRDRVRDKGEADYRSFTFKAKLNMILTIFLGFR